MRKAVCCRKARNRTMLAAPYQNSPDEFEAPWDMRLESWLSEARTRARE